MRLSSVSGRPSGPAGNSQGTGGYGGRVRPGNGGKSDDGNPLRWPAEAQEETVANFRRWRNAILNRDVGGTPMTQHEARQVLAIEAESGDAEIRAAYLRKVKEHPPDRDPQEFERVRDAYEMLRDRRRRMRSLLLED